MATICKLNKFSHCKFGRFCHFIHENRKCKNKNCNARNCDLRHPKPCRYILQKKDCKFGAFCSFEHGVGDLHQQATPDALDGKLKELEGLLKVKDNQIKKLEIKILEFESEKIFNQSDSDLDTDSTFAEVDNVVIESGVTEEEAEVSDDESALPVYKKLYSCDQCDFQTEHERGLKTHVNRMHSLVCEVCDEKLKGKEQMRRHMKMEEIFENIGEKKNEEFGLELMKHGTDEACFAIFSVGKVRDDKLPLLYLHCDECWNHSGHSCPDLPFGDNIDSATKEDLLLNHDFYDPTLHAMLEGLVMGDMSMKGCYPDWSEVNKLICKN